MIATRRTKRKGEPLQRLELTLSEMIKIEPELGSVIRECFRSAQDERSMWVAYGRAKETVRREKMLGWTAVRPALRTSSAYEKFAKELAWALMERVDSLIPANAREAFTRQMIPADLRDDVWLSTNGRCWYCGIQTLPSTFSVDHIHPVADGGSNDPENLVPCCKPCNGAKHAMPLEMFRRRRGGGLFWFELRSEGI